jgi:hypothetical protein
MQETWFPLSIFFFPRLCGRGSLRILGGWGVEDRDYGQSSAVGVGVECLV